MKCRTYLVFFLVFAVKVGFGQSPFVFNEEIIKKGTKRHFEISIKDGEQSTFIPITVFCGVEEGPVLGITAGVHGYEYPPILAGQRLIKSLNPKTLRGVVILVQIANLASFKDRSPYVNPLDHKNLNRTFPGDSNGSITEKIADFITQNVISNSDFFLDMHAGDAPEDLMPYSAYYSNSTMPSVSEKGKEMAMSLLFDYVIVFETDGKDYLKKDKPSLYCSAEAFKRGIPAVDIECGGLGKVEANAVHQIETGVLNMLNQLDMLITNFEAKKNNTYQFISTRTYQESNYDGIFYPSRASGDFVQKGMKLGVITNYFGDVFETVYAETSGVILYILGTPPINKGETIVAIGEIDQ